MTFRLSGTQYILVVPSTRLFVIVIARERSDRSNLISIKEQRDCRAPFGSSQ